MLPPISKEVLSNNPQFSALYENLKLGRLDGDGASKLDDKTATELRVFQQAVYQARVKSAQQDLLSYALSTLARAATLPAEQSEVVAIVASILDGHFASEDTGIVYDVVQALKNSLPSISALIAQVLYDDMGAVEQLMAADAIPNVDRWAILQIRETLKQSEARVNDLRSSNVEQAIQLHEDYRQATRLCVRALEQTVHGVEARATKAKVEYLTTVAEGMSKKAHVQRSQLLATMQTPEAQADLKPTIRTIKLEAQELNDKTSELEETLTALRAKLGSDSELVMTKVSELIALKGEVMSIEG